MKYYLYGALGGTVAGLAMWWWMGQLAAAMRELEVRPCAYSLH